MKHSLLSLSLILFYSFSYSQVYHPLLKQNAYWNVIYGHTAMCECDYPFEPGCSVQTNYSSQFLGDTITLQNKLWWEVRSNVETYCDLFSPKFSSASLNQLETYLREDTAERKVYMLKDSDEVLLFDFTLEIGDTVPISDQYQTVTVSQTDSILIGNSYRKRWICDAVYNSIVYSDFTEIIEGIGYTCGGIASCITYAFETFYSFNCYIENGQVLYPDGVNQCEFITAVNLDPPSAAFTVYPDPFNDYLKLESIGLTIRLLTVYNSTGQTIYIDNSFVSQHEIFLSTNSWDPGIYLVTIIASNGVFSQKLIKL